jgi:NAD(P)-dependent dehydrogenase (short-subunit alcohol dehydrogenase family)
MPQKVALVTGASSGIGEATARELADRGYLVYAAARRTDRMAPLAELGIVVEFVDVTDDASMVALVDTILSSAGRIDVLVNNAGYGSYGALEDVSIDEARRQFEVNVFGLARLTQLVLPHMRAQRDGYVVNISSIGGRIWEPMGCWYHAAKYAVEGLSNSLRAEVAEFGIKVIVIQPGGIRTEWGGISADNLDATSADSPYREQAAFVGATLRALNDSRLISEPSVIAKAIGRAVGRSRPRTRYAVGGGARSMLMAERLLTDRGFDRFIRTGYKIASRM